MISSDNYIRIILQYGKSGLLLSTYTKLMPFSYHSRPDMFMFLPNSNPYHVVCLLIVRETRFHITNISGSGVGWGSVLHQMFQLTTNQLTTNKLTANRIPSLMVYGFSANDISFAVICMQKLTREIYLL